MMPYALGKKPARDAVSFRFGTYFDAAALPAVPRVFGRPGLVQQYGILSNDAVGDCVWAGAAHETMLWRAEAGSPVSFTDQAVLGDYAAATGYDPADPSTDQGTDMQQAASYRKKTGIQDASGARHRVDAYVALLPGNIDQIALAAFLFGAVGIGIQLPDTAMDQFDRAEPWDVVAGARVEGGHYVPIVGRNSAGNFLCVSWGRLHAVAPRFLATYMDEGLGYLSIERLKGKVSPQGFDAATLAADLNLLNAPSPPRTSQEAIMADAPTDSEKIVALQLAARKWLTDTAPGWVAAEVSDAELTSLATAQVKALNALTSAQTI